MIQHFSVLIQINIFNPKRIFKLYLLFTLMLALISLYTNTMQAHAITSDMLLRVFDYNPCIDILLDFNICPSRVHERFFTFLFFFLPSYFSPRRGCPSFAWAPM